MTSTTILVLGGARSGKSTWAEARFADRAEVIYVATSARDPEDTEWEERVQLHRERRPASWRTVETLDLADVLRTDGTQPVLIDCLAVWLTRVLDEVEAWEDAENWRDALAIRVDEVVDAVAETSHEVVLVSNEVGLGVVPASRAGRLFRDELGRLNAKVAAVADEVWLSIAGITKRWD